MILRQQIIEDRVHKLATELKISNDMAFLRFAHSMFVDQSIASFDASDLVDGGQDKQIDIITIESNNDEATVYILQVKNTNSFSSNTIIQMGNGLSWIFNQPRSEISKIINQKFKDKILEYRAIQSELGPSNLHIVVGYITYGLTNELSDECKQEIKKITNEYDNDTFASFEFLAWGADELVNTINIYEKKAKKIDAKIKIRFDINTPSLIRYETNGLKGIICTAAASEIARLVNEDEKGHIFDQNIRKFLGSRGNVNEKIIASCTDLEQSYLFWFLNNGITIICDHIDHVTDPDEPHLKLKNVQIVNGCQTSSALALCLKRGTLAGNTRVLLRIYETKDHILADKIVLTTNNQNKIDSQNLHSNDAIQMDIEKAFLILGYYYERKKRQYENDPDVMKDKVVTNDQIAVAYLSIVLKKPSDARSRKYKVWGEMYDKIFSGKTLAESYLVVYLIWVHTKDRLKNNFPSENLTETEQFLARNGHTHIARIVAFLWNSSDKWDDRKTLKKQLKDIDENPSLLDSYIDNAFYIFSKIITTNETYVDLSTALKSYQLDHDIEKYLHMNK